MELVIRVLFVLIVIGLSTYRNGKDLYFPFRITELSLVDTLKIIILTHE